jgi:hypothetical protein
LLSDASNPGYKKTKEDPGKNNLKKSHETSLKQMKEKILWMIDPPLPRGPLKKSSPSCRDFCSLLFVFYTRSPAMVLTAS